ncbi:phosphatidylinositol 4-kinase alpha [Coccomyxa sp. Obi]|nr:phosphatidylinositol 4-kinase alpha [Coccomyxa sp. Obi]
MTESSIVRSLRAWIDSLNGEKPSIASAQVSSFVAICQKGLANDGNKGSGNGPELELTACVALALLLVHTKGAAEGAVEQLLAHLDALGSSVHDTMLLDSGLVRTLFSSLDTLLHSDSITVNQKEGISQLLATIFAKCLSDAPPSVPLLAALSDAAVPLPVLPMDACGILGTISAGISEEKGSMRQCEMQIALHAMESATLAGVQPSLESLTVLHKASKRELQDILSSLSAFNRPRSNHVAAAFPSQAALTATAGLCAQSALLLDMHGRDKDGVLAEAFEALHAVADSLLSYILPLAEGQPARLALVQRLLCVLAPMQALQRAVGQGASVASMQKVAALARAQLVRIGRMPSARQPWMGMQRWDAKIRSQPRTEQEAALLAVRISVGSFAGFLAPIWAAGHRTLVEASLAALINNAFTIEPAVEAHSAAQEQQAALMVLDELMALEGHDEELARLLFPLLVTRELREAAAPVKATGVLLLGHFGSSCARRSNRWGYERAAELLSRLYKSPKEPVPSQLMWEVVLASSGDKTAALQSPHAGAVANAWTVLAGGACVSDVDVRWDCRNRLVALFLDKAFILEPGEQQGALRDLGSLLHPLSVACTAPPGMDVPVENSEENSKALLLVWLYVAVHGFAAPSSHGASPWPPSWQEDAGKLAAEGTPAAVLAGSDNLDPNISAELAVRLNNLGSKGTAPFLGSALLRLLGRGNSAAVPAGDTAAAAQLLATAAANITRVAYGPLPEAQAAQPLVALLNGIKVVDPASLQARVLENILDSTLETYCSRLQGLKSTLGDTSDSREVAADSVATSLVQLIPSGTERTQSFSGRLLGRLLRTFPGLKWSRSVLGALYASLGTTEEESDDVLHTSCHSALTETLKQAIREGAVEAPGHTEAVLQELFIAGQDSLASYAPGLSANLTASLAAGRAAFPMASLLQSHSSTLTVTRKAHVMGLVTGAMGAAGSVGPEHAAEQQLVQRQLARDLAEAGPSLDERAFSNRCFRAAAALIATANQGLPGQRHLLPALCHCCVEPLQLDRLRVALVSWHWIAAAAPSLQVELVSGVAREWHATATAQVGLFDTSFNATAFRNSTGSPQNFSAVTNAIAAHHLWISFFLESWQTATHRIGSIGEAVLRTVQALVWESLAHPHALSQHPASVGARFRLLLLGLKHARHLQASGSRGTAAALHERVLVSALMWFSNPVAYYGGWSAGEAREQAAAVEDFARLFEAVMVTWPGRGNAQNQSSSPGSSAQVSTQQRLALVHLLLEDERERLHTWANPLEADIKRRNAVRWDAHVAAAWATHPRLAPALLDRFPAETSLRQLVEQLVAANAAQARLQELPDAAALLATPAAAKSGDSALSNLKDWAPAPLLQALVMMGGPAGQAGAVRTYALRSLRACTPEQVAFFLPQLVQQLRRDDGHLMRDFLLDAAKRSRHFAHHLVCTLRSEAKPPEEAFSPAVKRSGWQPPKDTGLWEIAGQVQGQVFEQMPEELLRFLEDELAFFDKVTDISGSLYPVPKDERKAGAVNLARQLKLPRDDLYLPTNPHYRVRGVIPESATPMQSAAKVPILVAFQVEDTERPEEGEKVQACIFKVGDDCRQDVLALQVVGLLKDALTKAGLHLYLAPYGVLPTAYECGIIEVVPNCNSRSGLGETADGSLYEIFRREFGAPGTPRFEAARQNFIASEAGYAIACFLLQAKDRHNGNILIDVAGHLVHIDFGFILEISPGGNMRFESAAFKLSHEMTLLVDPGGTRASREFRHFQDLCVRGFLAARGVAEGIIATVALMAQSGLPCYGRGRPVENLRKRFHLEMSDSQAAAFMRATIRDAYDKWTTGFYDYVQYLQNAIPK